MKEVEASHKEVKQPVSPKSYFLYDIRGRIAELGKTAESKEMWVFWRFAWVSGFGCLNVGHTCKMRDNWESGISQFSCVSFFSPFFICWLYSVLNVQGNSSMDSQMDKRADRHFSHRYA